MIEEFDIDADALDVSISVAGRRAPTRGRFMQSLLAPDKTGVSQLERDAYEATVEPSVLDLAVDVPVRLARGAIRGAGLAVSGVGALEEAASGLLPDAIGQFGSFQGQGLQALGAGIESLAPRGNPLLDKALLSAGAEGVGTSALPIAAGVLTGGLGAPAAVAAMGAGAASVAMEAGGGFTEALARGGSREQALQAGVLTAPAGLLDLVEFGAALRIARGIRGAGKAVGALEKAATVLERAGPVGGMAGAAVAEGLQETAQGTWEQTVQEMVGTITSEKDARSLWEIAQEEGMPGGVAGVMMEAVTRFLTRGMGRAAIGTDRAPDLQQPLQGIPGLGDDIGKAGAAGTNPPEGASGGAQAPAASPAPILNDADVQAALAQYDAARAPTSREQQGRRIPSRPYEAPEPMRQRASRLGVRVALFDAGEKSTQPGFYEPNTKTILIDLHASPEEQERALFNHEVVHFIAHNDIRAYDELAAAIDDVIPASDPSRPPWLDWYSRQREHMARVSAGGDPQNTWSRAAQKRGFDFAANHPLPVTPQGPILTPGVAREEAVAGTIEQLPTLHDFVRENRTLAVRIATHHPGVFRRLTDALRDFAVKIGIAKHKSVSRLLREMDALLADVGTELEKAIGTHAAIAIVLKFQALEESMAKADATPQSLGTRIEQAKGLEIPTTSADQVKFWPPDFGDSAAHARLFEDDGSLKRDAHGNAPSLPILRDTLAKTEEAIDRNRGSGKQAKRRKKLERRAAELRDAIAVRERQERHSTPKNVGDRVRLQSGEEGTVTSVKGESLKVFVPERKFGDPDTTLGIPEPRSRTVSASSVELIEKSAKAPTRTPLPVSRPQAREATAAQPSLSKEDLRTDPDAQAVIQMGRNAQSGYLGHKGAFVGRFVALLKKLFRNSLSDVESIFDVYSGGGSYGLSYATTGMMPKLKRIVLNEFNPHRLARLRLALDSGADYLNEWNTNQALVSLRAALIPLMGGSASPAQRSLATVLGEKDGTLRPEFLKWQESVAGGSPRVRAAVVSMLDVMVGGYTADWSRAFEKATTDANKLQSMARTVKAQGATIELTSLDSRSPEMLQRVRSGGRSLVLSDSPYHGTSSGAYSGSGKREDFASTENMKLFAEAARKMASGNVLVFHNSATPEVRTEMEDLFDGNIAVHEWIRSKKANAKAEYLGVYDGSRTSDYDGGRVSDDRTAAGTGQVVQDAGVLGDSGRHAERQTDAGAVGYASRARSERAARGELPVRAAPSQPERVAPRPATVEKAALPLARAPVPEPMPLLATTLLLPERAQSIVERQQALTTPRRSFLPIKPIALTQRAGAPAVQILVGDTVSVTQKDGRVHEGVVTEATGFGNVQRVRVKGLARPVDMERVTLVKRAGRVTPEQSVLREEASEERRLPIQPRFATREIDPLGFYSRLREQIAALPDPVKASTALSKLKANVSAEEMEWSNIERNLKSKQPDEKVTHADLRLVMAASYVADIEEIQRRGGERWWQSWHDVDVDFDEEVVNEDEGTVERYYTVADAGDNDTGQWIAHRRIRGARSWTVSDSNGDARFDAHLDLIEEGIARRAFEEQELNESARYAQYQTPGGTNYREILLTAPSLKPAFTSGHFDEANVLVHMRVNDRTVGDDKVLFAEEIQSDLHQKGRERGYFDSAENENLRRAMTEADHAAALFAREAALRHADKSERLRQDGDQSPIGVYNSLNSMIMDVNTATPEGRQWWIDLNTLNQRIEAAKSAETAYIASNMRSGIPDAPFKDTWPELAMKRLLTIAAQEGYQKLAWTTGAQQIDRYNEAMRQNVDKIDVEPRDHYVPRVVELDVDEDATGRAARPFAVELGGGVPNGRWALLNTFDTREEADEYARGVARQSTVYIRAHKNGQEKFGAEVPLEGETTIHGHKVALEDVVGKDIARKIKEKPGEKQTFKGEGLAIGGKGMQAFYDKRLRDIAKKLTKNEPHTIKFTGYERGHQGPTAFEVHAVDVPAEAIKEKGFPRFATRGESDYSEFFKQQRADIRERMKRVASGDSELDRPLANPARSKRARQFAEAVQEMRKESLSDDMRHTWERAQAEYRDLEASDPHGVKTLDKLLHGEALSEAETLQAQRLKEDAQREGFQAGPNALQKHAEAVALEYHYAAARAQASGILRNVRDRFRTKQERFLASLYGPNMDAMRRARKAKTPEARDKILAKEVAKIQRALFALADAGFSPSMLTDDYFADDQTAARMADIAARAKGDFWDWVYAWRASAMQASTLSWARNITSNSAHIAFDNVFAKALSSTPAETKAYVYDMISAVPDAWKAGYATWRWGIHEGTSVDEIQKAPGWLGLRVLEKLGVDANAGADVYFRHIVAAAELRAAARFLSKKEGRPIQDYLDNPELIERAEAAGLYSTFANRDRLTGALQAIRGIADIGGFSPGKLIVPFIATPTRLVVRGLEVAAGPVPPLVRIGLKDMAQDQKLREMGKALAGLGVWAAVYALANATQGDDDQPWITGSRKLGKEGEQQERTAPAYSIWNPFSQSYLSYQNIDPFATALGVMVDVLQGNRSLPASFASTVKDKSFFRGVQMAYEAATDEAGGKLGRYARGTLVEPMIPNMVRSALPKAEPAARREITRTGLEALEPRRLGFSATGWPGWAPPPKFDRWGRPVAKVGRSWFARWFDMLPRTREAGEIEHIDILLSRYRDAEGKAVSFGAPSYQFERGLQPIVLTEEEYAELSRDSGLAAIARLRPWVARKQELRAQDIEHIRSVIRESESAIKDRIAARRRTILPVRAKE